MGVGVVSRRDCVYGPLIGSRLVHVHVSVFVLSLG